jgi:CHAT domain-containing protein
LKTSDIDAVHFSGHMRDPVDAAGWYLQLRDGDLDCLGALRSLAGRLRLVVLMACSAGATTTRSRSLEAGFPHALVALGAGAVIAPRRSIADPIAAGFSATFYAHMARGADLGEAYRGGIVSLIGDHRPGAWSALVLHGQ